MSEEEYHCELFEPCVLDCTSSASCNEHTYYGPSGYPFLISCKGSNEIVCNNIIVHAEDSSHLNIEVGAQILELNKANIYTPTGSNIQQPTTTIICTDGFYEGNCRNFNIYAPGGFNDVDMVCNNGEDCVMEVNSNKMLCGNSYQYHCTGANFVFNNGKYICDPLDSVCNEYLSPSMEPTVEPTIEPTIITLDEHSSNSTQIPTLAATLTSHYPIISSFEVSESIMNSSDNINWLFPMLFAIIVLLFVIILLAFIGFWCIRKRNNKPQHVHYSSQVEHNEENEENDNNNEIILPNDDNEDSNILPNINNMNNMQNLLNIDQSDDSIEGMLNVS